MLLRVKKKIYVFEALIFLFENILLLSISRNSFQTLSSDDILVGSFTWSNSIILVIDHYVCDIGNKNISGT